MRNIDLWNVQTFDAELVATLKGQADVICKYFLRKQEIFDTFHQSSLVNRPLLQPENEFSRAFCGVVEGVSDLMVKRSIRSFHNTRLTDDEVATLLSEGVHLSTFDSLRSRLAGLVRSGSLTQDDVDVLLEASPFQTQLDIREGKFWMTSHPLTICDGGVEGLLGVWGGEVASCYLRDRELKAKLSQIGRSRVVEVGVAVSEFGGASNAAQAAIAAFAESLGCPCDRGEFDLFITSPLPGDAILRVNSAGDESLDQMGKSYPEGFERRD